MYDFRIEVPLSKSSTPETLHPPVFLPEENYPNYVNILLRTPSTKKRVGTLPCSSINRRLVLHTGVICGLDDRGSLDNLYMKTKNSVESIRDYHRT